MSNEIIQITEPDEVRKKNKVIFGTWKVAGKVVSEIACDGKCNKAWGYNSRPNIAINPDDDDDYVRRADDELGKAPSDPGTYEGGDGKPTETPIAITSKWCKRECERAVLVEIGEKPVLPDLSKRRFNIFKGREERYPHRSLDTLVSRRDIGVERFVVEPCTIKLYISTKLDGTVPNNNKPAGDLQIGDTVSILEAPMDGKVWLLLNESIKALCSVEELQKIRVHFSC